MERNKFGLLLKFQEKMKIMVLIAWISSTSLTSAEFPTFNIQANSSFLSSGDTLVIKCLISNISLLDLVNIYSISWFKDDVQITKSYNDVIKDARYSVHLDVSNKEQNIISALHITSITVEDEGFFSCELTDRNNLNHRKFISIQIDEYGDSRKGNMTDRNIFSQVAVKHTTEHTMYTEFDPGNMTSVEKKDQNITNIMIGSKELDFEKSTIDTYNAYGSERSKNFTNMYDKTTQYHMETAIKSTQDYTVLVIALCVSVVAILAITVMIFEVSKRRRTQNSVKNGPSDPHQIITLHNKLLPDFEKAVNSRFEEVRMPEKGSRDQSSPKSYVNNPGYTFVHIFKPMKTADIGEQQCEMIEPDRRALEENDSLSEKAATSETCETKETNAPHSRSQHPPYEKWNDSFFIDYT